LFFNVNNEGLYECKKLPDEPNEPWGTEGWKVTAEDMKSLLYTVGVMRYNFLFKEFFEDQFSFRDEKFVPYTSRFECAKRDVTYNEEFEDDYIIGEDDLEDGDEWKKGNN